MFGWIVVSSWDEDDHSSKSSVVNYSLEWVGGHPEKREANPDE